MKISSKPYQTGVAANFINEKLAAGFASFSLDELIAKTGLSVIAAKNQLLRLGDRVTRVSPRHQYFLIVTPEHRSFGAPPVDWWLGDYMQWLGHPYYLGLQSAAMTFGSSQQAIQETQIMTDIPRREIIIGRIRIRFFYENRHRKITCPAASRSLRSVEGEHTGNHVFRSCPVCALSRGHRAFSRDNFAHAAFAQGEGTQAGT